MKVLFLSKSHPVIGGTEQWLDLLVSGLVKAKIDCLVGLAEGASFHKAEVYQEVHRSILTAEVKCITGTPTGRLHAVRTLLKKYRPDVVVPVMLFDGLLGAAHEKCSASFSIVYPVHLRCSGALQDVVSFRAFLDSVVAIDELTHRLIVRHIPTVSDRVLKIPCGVPPAKDAVTLFSESRMRLGYCGRLENDPKRVFDLVELYEHLWQLGLRFQIAIVGAGSDDAELRSRFSAVEKPDNPVVFLGRQSQDWLYKNFYPELDVLVLCSEYEGVPLAAAEAMAHGCLVASSDYLGRAEERFLVDDANSIVFPLGSMKEAAARISEVFDRKDHAKELASEGKLSVTRERLVDVMVERWRILLEQTIESDDRSPADPSVLPSFRYESRLEKWGLSPRAAEVLRRISGRQWPHATAASEWPYYSSPSAEIEAIFREIGG